MDDMILAVAAMVPLAAGVYVGRRSGLWAGIGVGLALFVVLVLGLVAAGYGY